MELTEVPKDVKEFMCPLCGCKEYTEHKGNNKVMGPGGYSWVKFYECNGCSVLFRDIDKFSNIQKKGDNWEEACRASKEGSCYRRDSDGYFVIRYFNGDILRQKGGRFYPYERKFAEGFTDWKPGKPWDKEGE